MFIHCKPLRCTAYLNIVLGEFFCKRSSSTGKRIDGIVDRNLAIFTVQPGVDVFSAFLKDLLAKHDGRGGSIDKEVVFGHIHIRTHGSTTIVSEVEDASLYSEPVKFVSDIHTRSWNIPTIAGSERGKPRCVYKMD